MGLMDIKLPVLPATATVREAFDVLKRAGTSGLVVLDEKGPVVITDRSLHNGRGMTGPNGPVSLISRLAFPFPVDAASESGLRGLIGKIPGVAPRQHRTVLASDQDYYVVKDYNNETATVFTETSRADALLTPSRLVDAPNGGTAANQPS
jgi:CBS domain-containing protein